MRSPAHNHFHHMSAFILHSYQPAGPSTTGPWLPMSLQLFLEAPRGNPDPASWGTWAFHLQVSFCPEMRIDQRQRELYTWCPSNISPKPWRCHQEVKLPGGTRLWHFPTPRDQRKTNSCHKTSRKAGKTLDLPQPSSVHSFIHSEMLMQARSWALGMQRGANRKQSPHSENLLPTGGDKYYPSHYLLNHEKFSVEQQWQNQNTKQATSAGGLSFSVSVACQC